MSDEPRAIVFEGTGTTLHEAREDVLSIYTGWLGALQGVNVTRVIMLDTWDEHAESRPKVVLRLEYTYTPPVTFAPYPRRPNAKPTYANKVCAFCEKSYTPTNARQRYCDAVCRGLAYADQALKAQQAAGGNP